MKAKFGTMVLALTISYGALSNVKNPSLKEGECFAQVYTKKYLNNHEKKATFAEKNHYIYTCEYTCLDNNKNAHSVLARHEKRVQNEHEMSRRVVCDGVIMKELGNENLRYYDLSHIERFYSKTSKLKELQTWAINNNISDFSMRINKKIKKLKEKLQDLNKSYQLSIKNLDPSHGAYQLLKDADSQIQIYLSLQNSELYELAKNLKISSKKRRNTKSKGLLIAEGNLKNMFNIYVK